MPTGRMSNKQKLLKIIVAYLADSRGMPQTRRQGGSAGGQCRRAVPLLPTVRRIKGDPQTLRIPCKWGMLHVAGSMSDIGQPTKDTHNLLSAASLSVEFNSSYE